jgi:hypothetical protein
MMKKGDFTCNCHSPPPTPMLPPPHTPQSTIEIYQNFPELSEAFFWVVGWVLSTGFCGYFRVAMIVQ